MTVFGTVRAGLGALAPVTGQPAPRLSPGEQTTTFATPMATPPRAAAAAVQWTDVLVGQGAGGLDLEQHHFRSGGATAADGAAAAARVSTVATADGGSETGTLAPAQLAKRQAANRAGIDLQDVAGNIQRARSVGVEPARAGFLRRLAGATFTGLLAVGVAALAVLSGGTALAVGAAAVMGVLLVKVSLDTWQAHRVLQNARAVAEGRPEPHRLPMGGDVVGNLIHGWLPDSWAPEKRQKVAGALSFGITISLATAAGVLSGGAAAIPSAVAASSGALAVGLYAYLATRTATDEVGLTAFDGQALDRYMDIGDRLNTRLADTTNWGHIGELREAIQDLDAEVGAMAAGLEKNTLFHQQGSTAGKVILDLLPDVAQTSAAANQVTGAGLIGNGLRALLVAGHAYAVSSERRERNALVDAQAARADALDTPLRPPVDPLSYA